MKTLFYSLFLLALLGTIVSCKKMDKTYEKFLVPGGITYTAKATAAKAHTGHNRVQIVWLRGTDASVTTARIFWNNYADSVEVAIPPTGSVISKIIDNLQERSYSFVIKTYNAKGDASVPVELISASYGEKFQAGLLSRPLLAATLDEQQTVTLNWGLADISGGAFASEIRYIDKTDKMITKRYTTAEQLGTIANVKAGSTLKYRTLYLPDTLSIDTFYTDFQEKKQFRLDKSTWQVIDYSSQHPGGANQATNIIDGKTNTRWHTLASNPRPPYPHFATIDIRSQKTITTFELFRMSGDARACNTFQMLVSKDNITWTDLGTFDFNPLSDAGQLYPISSTPKARYFKFVGLSGPENYMVTGEINLYGY